MSQALSDHQALFLAVAITVTKCELIAMFVINAGAPATTASRFGRPRTTSAIPSTDLVISMGLQFYWLVNLRF